MDTVIFYRSPHTIREAFIRFNVAGMASVQNARLRLTPSTSLETNKTLLTTYVDVEAFASGEWSETAVTWNNSPYGYALPIRTQDLTWPDQVQKVRFRIGMPNVQQEIDITPLVRRVARRDDQTGKGFRSGKPAWWK